MAISNVDVGQSSAQNITEIIGQASTNIDGIVGEAKFSIFSAGADFAGMDSKNIPAFHAAVDKYREGIQGIIEKFTAISESQMGTTYKGDVAEAASNFLESMKVLLRKYVAAIDIEKKEITDANTRWLEAAGTIASNVTSDSDQIRSAANGIDIE